MIAYHVWCKNFSVRYGENVSVDIFVCIRSRGVGVSPIIPMDILFLKREENVYFLLLPASYYDQVVPPELLHNIVK